MLPCCPPYFNMRFIHDGRTAHDNNYRIAEMAKKETLCYFPELQLNLDNDTILRTIYTAF